MYMMTLELEDRDRSGRRYAGPSLVPSPYMRSAFGDPKCPFDSAALRLELV